MSAARCGFGKVRSSCMSRRIFSILTYLGQVLQISEGHACDIFVENGETDPKTHATAAQIFSDVVCLQGDGGKIPRQAAVDHCRIWERIPDATTTEVAGEGDDGEHLMIALQAREKTSILAQSAESTIGITMKVKQRAMEIWSELDKEGQTSPECEARLLTMLSRQALCPTVGSRAAPSQTTGENWTKSRLGHRALRDRAVNPPSMPTTPTSKFSWPSGDVVFTGSLGSPGAWTREDI